MHHPDRSPDPKKPSNSLLAPGVDPRGKTFTATRIGNFSSSKADQQIFPGTGDRHYKGQPSKSQHIAQHRLSKGPSETMMAYGGGPSPNSPPA